MGRIKKAAGSKHEATISPYLSDFIKLATKIPLAQLPSHLRTLPRTWPFPRGDLYHWIPLLDRFDDILASVIEQYGLNIGPQVTPFGRHVLLDASADQDTDVDELLSGLGYGSEGDRELVEAILSFSQLLQEKCGNRSLYSSSDRLNDLLNTTSNTLLITTLRLALLLAQRYHARQRNASATHFQQALLAAHYNIDLDKVQKLSSPFARPTVFGKPPVAPTSPAVKAREKAVQTRHDANDAAVLLREKDGWEEWGNIRAVYYPGVSELENPLKETQPSEQSQQYQAAPSTPTPLRRSATMPTPRLSRMSSNEDSPSVYTGTPSSRVADSAQNSKLVEIPAAVVSSTSLESIIGVKLGEIPTESKYDFLHRARVAQSLVRSEVTREQILTIRILALTNLAYLYPEAIMQQRILQQDSDQPKRLQIAYQLAELAHLGASGDLPALRTTQTAALYALDALTKHKARSADVCAALNVNVNHGILMFLTRKTITELSADQDDGEESDEWRDALLLLLRTLPGSSSRTPETLIAAGLIPMFVDVLNLRTEKARRVYPRVLEFLDTFVHAVRDALGTLANAKGFDAISDLIGFETKSAFDNVNEGIGIPTEYRTPSVDYDIPYFQQQSLRWLFRFVNHIMQHNGGGFDRLLRNLVDSPPLLTALRLVFENAKIFGSHVWSGAVSILSSFIHNEPTSYAVIAEAGLSKSLLEAITLKEVKGPEVEATAMAEEDESRVQSAAPSSGSTAAANISYSLSRSADQQLARGIIPASEAMSCIPQAFGAICLNSAGLELFQSSDALESYFEIFESPVHVKCMDANLVRSLGTTFDELVRHHPSLKQSVMSAVLVMVARVGLLCKKMAYKGAGAKLWTSDEQGNLTVIGGKSSLCTEVGESFEDTAERDGQFSYPALQERSLPNGGKLNLGQVPDAQDISSTPPDADEWGLTAANYIYPVMRFLGAFFENQVNCTYFIESGGVEFILDFATLPSLTFDFQSRQANTELAQLVHMMAETKPHLVIPSLVKRTQKSVDCLADFFKAPRPDGFFTSLTKPELGDAMDTGTTPERDIRLAEERGTYYVKHLVSTHVLTDILREIYTTPMYQTRPSQQTSAFSQVNLAEQYTNLVISLGQLHAACVWDEILVQKNLPQRWIEATKVRGYDLGSEEANEALGMSVSEDRRNPLSNVEPAPATSSTTPAAPEDRVADSAPTAPADEGAQSDDERKPAFKNTQALRYLLSSLPTTISGFFHLLGHGILGKRRPDAYSRQNASMVADAIAGVVIRQLQLDAPNKSSDIRDRFSYLIVILSAFTQLLFEAPVERSHSHCLTAILFAFKRQNGLNLMKNLCGLFLHEINSLAPQAGGGFDDPNKSARLASAYGGLRFILTFFAEVTSVKESSQTQALLSTERERDRPDYFNPGQFLVDLRMEVLPMVRELWSSDFVDRASSSIVKCLVEILRNILDGEHENGAIVQRINGHQFYSEYPKKEFFLNQDRLNTLVERGFDLDLAHEALYRCNNVLATADEYCHAQTWLRPPPRLRPESDLESTRRTNTGGDDAPVPDASSNLSVADTNYALARIIREGPPRLVQGEGSSNNNVDHEAGSNAEFLTRALSRYFGDPEALLNESQDDAPSRMHRRAPSESVAQSTELRRREITTIEDLDAERDKLRKNMIERCLDVLNVHHDVTFELADLISSATKKHRDLEGFRKEVGETLVQSLISLQIDDDVQPSGKKIAAYANLLALVLQDRSIYLTTLDELKECFLTLLGFIKIPISDKAAEESSPWVGQVLLVIEKLLSDDSAPPQIQWDAPSTLDEPVDTGPAYLKPSLLLSSDEKTQLFESLLDVLPRVGKDESLALSVCRALVILTRARHIAIRMGEKRNLQRLFVMMKQLSSSSNDRLQGAFMLILRHIVEDDETVRQIMRSEITASFESRSSRQTDTTAYVRQMYHLVLRSPEIFVEVTNEILKIQRYEPSQRPQNLALKAPKAEAAPESKEPADKVVDTVEGKEPTDTKDKGKVVELKPPVVEHPDGVIHYLLSELLSYRDVEDKDSGTENVEAGTANAPEPHNEPDISVGETSPSSSTADLGVSRESKKQEKPAFKADDHPIYIYRCFLLQCLTELLSSYNRTKVEFINYSRKADPMATTPSKPRGGVLNYLLNTLVPTGTLEHDESVSFKKRSNTSSCAMRVLVALCTKTGEFGGTNRRRNVEDEEEEPELLFVRRFVLEHALKAYKDAMSSTEPLDMKYSRLMCLADLFDKMLSGYTFASGDTTFPSSTRQLAKTMFEKHFISALTASIADVDLNFPASKRVIKYILRPLNKLTQTAVLLSESSSISTLGETEEYEISSATSVSDLDDDREETPDLFRHSTLGMLEPNHEEDTSEEESEEDDEMYDDEYGDEMDYDEDLPEDDGEVVSDEDEDLDGRGPIEGLPGDSGMDIEVLLDEDEDDDTDDDDDEEDDDDDSDMDDDDEIMAGEITGDRDNDSLARDEDDDWESEDMSEDNEEAVEMLNQLESEFGDFRQADPQGDGSRFENLFRVIHEAAGAIDDFTANRIGGDPQEDLVIDGMNEEEDEEEEDEVDELEEGMDDMDDDQLSYDEGIDDEDMEPWGWDGEEPPSRHHHHHHHRHVRGTPAWTSFPSGINRHGIIPIPPYHRSQRQMGSRNTDDGTNPLLIRSDRGPDGTGQIRGAGNEAFTDWIQGGDSTVTGRVISMDTPVSFMNAIMQAIEGQGGPGFGVITRPDGIHVHVDRRALMPGNQLQGIFELGRPQNPTNRSRDDPLQAISFALATTTARWQEEARILFSSNHIEKAQRVINFLLRALVPPAIEEEKKRRAEEEDARRRREEARLEKERAERLAREEEEREQRRKEAEEAARRQEELAQQPTVEAEEVDEPMNDAESAESLAEAANAEAQETGPSEPVQRIYTNIRGRQVDITGMEIDPEYLEALPEDLREEVIMQQLAEQRSQAVASGEEPTDISQEFLEALPPEIREEILQAEAAARRRRERESARRQVAASGGPAHAEEMDPASFMATLDPSLRQSVLADQPDEILATLGPEFLSEARALPGRRLAQFGDVGRVEQRHRDEVHDQDNKKPQRRQIVQILDKAGVATLLRLMFMPLQGNARHQLHDILHNVCENRQNRVETISLILSILQDGSLDSAAIERSFAQLSLRAKMPPAQKTPQSAKRPQVPPASSSANNDVTPLLVVQQCLDTLSFLTQYNPHISWFFLTEHESASMLKLRAIRKGKGKEAKDNRYPLNALLSLLDRDMIMESPNCMEQLAHLLSAVTQPLTILLRREKEKQEEAPKGKEPERAADAANASGGATGQATEVHDTDMSEVADAAGIKTSENEEKPKKRTIEPPVIPDHNLQLVVGILAARECNGKTFRETLSTINNLSAIPGAKDVIGKELISQAQALSEAILIDLDELLPHIEQASSGTDVQGLALSKFSPASSDQAKLLRILTALDYLFDPNRVDKVKGAEPESAPKEDVLKTLYENSTFGPLWSKLSACLTIIRQKENMLNVATTLLPLIEALMVVCKNTSLKDAPISRFGRELSVATPTSENGPGMENLFFNFTEEHRKILNELVRQNPRLMSGTFSLLVKNPKVLEFDNKRNYFTRRIHARSADVRQPHPPLQLSVRRDQVFLDSFKSLYFKTAEEVKYGKLNIRFHGEEGVDAGGVTREWFQVLARGMFNPNYALFIPVASDRTTFHPNRLSGVNTEHLMFFKFIGRIIGKALYEGRVLDCHFSRAVYKSILGKSVSIKDMETLDLDYYKSLLWMLENDITDIITETFAIETDDFGETQVIDLIPNGRNIPVTQENKEEYVQRVVEYKLVGSVKEQLENFLKGFHDIIQPDLISIFNEQELELLISGLPEIDVDDWKNNTEYHNYSASSQQIQWFWRAVRSFDKEERAKLLQFVTGTSKVPLNGFKELEGMNGFSRFNIHRDYGNKDRLPSSHTCFNQLDLPEYESYEDLRSRLYKAMTAGGDYFGFA
ncbi:ubiquitin-protein ligase (Tom1), putative [Talaromyces stipitatus ATCC 10500]|uniref:HECT-type E3 ubiquitin transferase n=1 Tax=Talaromyces stipitatus (strain ATCC 10500 / CBS 375.48 / QM 6759 / NRRL 1006) TaxID=441959 RepID=B8LWP1_TALSN|nr:ubiquitin-protein ligase (Tom1), putative [Talaromyces stipitatus ATCC 10500]EED24438.1 ubiquitin-protein ligase (Tom1), putative [Talaromyces stipitatus ATCC 10500]